MKRRKSIKRTQKGGADDAAEESTKLVGEQIIEFNQYKSLLNEFIKKEKKTNTEEMKYTLFKDKFAEFDDVSKKQDDSITQDDLKLVKTLVYLIIKDEVSDRELLFNKNVAGFQTMINNFIMYLINDAPFEEKVVMKLLKGIVNKKPYVKVSYDKNTNNFIFDVNELLANIKNELGTNPDASRYIYQKAIKMKSNLEAIP
jgi:hypothetical protein